MRIFPHRKRLGVGVIGVLLSPKVKDNLTLAEPISPRIMLLEFSGNPKLTVICAYSPHNESPEDVDRFYSDLRSVLDKNDFICQNFVVLVKFF